MNFYAKEDADKSYVYKPLSKLAPAVFPYLHFESIRDSLKESLKPDDSKE